MTETMRHPALAALEEAVREGRAHTVRVCFPDHYGVLRGRRIDAESFLRGALDPQAFCDGALVWDIRCEIFEEVDFSNYRTGYPDLYVRPDLETLRPCGWVPGEHMVLGHCFDHHGTPLEVSPRRVLAQVLEGVGTRVEVSLGLELRIPDDSMAAAWAPGFPPPFARALQSGLADSGLGSVALGWERDRRVARLALTPRPALAAADAMATARTAARELSAEHGIRLSAMPRLAAADDPARMRIEVRAPESPAPGFAARLSDVELLLRPLPLAYAGEDGAGEGDGAFHAHASSDACPHLAVAALVAAAHAHDGDLPCLGERGYRAAIARLRNSDWVRDWFAPLFLHDTLALADREAELRERQVTGWDLERYWECG